MLLFLDTSDYKTVKFALVTEKNVREFSWSAEKSVSELFSSKLRKFIKQNKVKLEQLKKIGVIIGPGQFTQIRTGIAYANALGFSLNIPVVGVKKDSVQNIKQLLKLKGQKQIKPFYDKAPNITKAKKRKLNF
ncbi:MAG TPA: tRNA (adenosine(37)-N6)-threonylcarbamoyltransferase complex dimerization subunit type 1 TsaB [Verrucomicrobiae bacterium]|nr:tRNA (adenosine(37)-N6)-threonylcarbamoyltransferase complex dimerization subunit type 1 TsaB [Verrucomicrobiae bacterium]